MASRLAPWVLAAVVVATAAPRTASQDALQRAFDRYDSGDYAGALSGLDLQLTAGALRATAERC